ncbi:LysR family transcriptional regulator [Nocardiopsis baichengensis]|uniref:LysR family transcriptional regulator n=1 Tax=Nocardiopsis baichengensis TaxID=280240 RepID=UPI00034C6C66|nr:LysR family transcriptional regulator [Nocardiopsis baichengensis]
MEVKQLRALVTVAEAGSVTRAADLLHLVQPAVTRQIRTLEHELGVELFERTRQGMRPTAAGRTVVERARRALAELDRARAEVRPAPGEVAGIVTLGLLESTLDLLAEPLVAALARDRPGIELRLLTGYSGYLRQWLDDGDLDLTLAYNLESTPSLNARPVLEDGLWAAAPAPVGLSPGRPVPFAEVCAHPLVMPAPGHSLRVLIDAAARHAGVQTEIAAQTNSMDLQKRLVVAGHGWTILPAPGFSADVEAGALSAAPLCDPAIDRSLVLAAPRARRTPPAVDAVARALLAQVETAVKENRWPAARLRGTPAA